MFGVAPSMPQMTPPQMFNMPMSGMSTSNMNLYSLRGSGNVPKFKEKIESNSEEFVKKNSNEMENKTEKLQKELEDQLKELTELTKKAKLIKEVNENF